MKQKGIVFVCVALSLAACTLLPAAPRPTSKPLPSAPALPSPTARTFPTPEPTQEPARLQLQALIGSKYWPALGLPAGVADKWLAYASGRAQLSTSEKAGLENFLAQWGKWSGWLTSARIPSYETLTFQVQEFRDAPAGQELTLYAYDEASTQKEGAPRLYLPPPPELDQPKALILAPRIEGLSQRISQTGAEVEYLTEREQPLLRVDAFRMWNNVFMDYIRQRYAGSYKVATLYPRFRFFIPEVSSGFFLLDKNLSLEQINFLEQTLELYNAPGLEPLKAKFFAEKMIYMVVGNITDIPNASGLTSAGVIILDRGDLFHLKDDLAAVIAHEATHVLQVDSITARCAYEIGDGTIPPGFEDWMADQLLVAIEAGKIGAEHTELWVYFKLDSGDTAIQSSRDAILSQGKNYWDYCSPGGSALAEVEIINQLGKPLKVILRGPTPKTITIRAGGSVTIEIEPGDYEYELIVTGYEPLRGFRSFSAGSNPWRVYRG